MDDRTESQKLYDTALPSERRTIGHRMSRKVLVIAPSHKWAQEWANEHGIAYSDTIHIGPDNFSRILPGVGYGVEHVILGWYAFDTEAQSMIRHHLLAICSAPFEGETLAEFCGADPERV